MKNLVVRNATIKIVAAALTVGFVFSTSALQAQEKDLKSELYSDFDKIEDALWNEPSQEILMGLIDEESANVERLAKEGLKALDALLEIMDSPSTRFSNNAKMVAMCVAVKVIKEEEVIQAWEASVLGSTTSVRSKLDSLEGILTNRIVQFQDSKILEKFLTNLSGPNAEIQAASIHYLKNMILGLNAQKMRFSFTKDAKAANPIRALVNDPRLQVRRDALFVLALAGDESDFEFIAEKMADPNYDLEAKISIPTLLAMINSEKAFDPIKKLLEAKDANGGSSPELLRVQCIAGLSQCTTETVGDMVEVENAERVDELRELFTKIFVSGKESVSYTHLTLPTNREV